jgi:hypothetical protein
VSDWNATDADLKVRKPGLIGRIALTSAKSLTRKALREAGARRISGADEPRLENIVAGLAERLDLGQVDTYLIDGRGANALAGRVERPVVGVTRALLDGYARTELEAVVAHCLVRFRDSGRRGAMVGFSDDVRAVALTRYPPALASAIEKAEPYGGRFGSLYLVAEGATHRPVKERIQALADL